MNKVYDYLCYLLNCLMLLSISLVISDFVIATSLPILYTLNGIKLILLCLNLIIVYIIMNNFYDFSTHHLF